MEIEDEVLMGILPAGSYCLVLCGEHRPIEVYRGALKLIASKDPKIVRRGERNLKAAENSCKTCRLYNAGPEMSNRDPSLRKHFESTFYY